MYFIPAIKKIHYWRRNQKDTHDRNLRIIPVIIFPYIHVAGTIAVLF